MKLFGKKKKSVVSTPKSDCAQQNRSDPVVEELLKKDPSTWNTKQRRLVRRFLDRQDKYDDEDAQEPPDPPNEDQETGSGTIGDVPKITNTVNPSEGGYTEVEANTVSQKALSESSCSDASSSSSASDDDGKLEASNSKSEDEDEQPKDDCDEKKNNSSVKRSMDETNEKLAAGDAMAIDQDLQTNLDKLNSKQRRTLVREFQRTGDLGKLQTQTEKLLNQSETTTQEPPKKKRRREKIDCNSLPREERLRREEQRRKQDAAAKARALSAVEVTNDKASSKKHKHPLNSERRRANRRKPKWLKRQPQSSQS